MNDSALIHVKELTEELNGGRCFLKPPKPRSDRLPDL